MDNINSLRVYPNDLGMLGDRVKMEMTRKQPMLSTYKTQISRSVHIYMEITAATVLFIQKKIPTVSASTMN